MSTTQEQEIYLSDVADVPERQLLRAEPKTIEETGLNASFIEDLALKILAVHGRTTLPQLTELIGLYGTVVDQITTGLRQAAFVESLPSLVEGEALISLTDAGQARAAEAKERSAYVGVAPVSMDDYVELVNQQRFREVGVTREKMLRVFREVVINPGILDRLGTAMNAGRSLFIYGTAGTGKTFIAEKLVDTMGGDILIPHAITVGGNVIRIYDGGVHRKAKNAPHEERLSLLKSTAEDRRYVRCRRPLVVVGGELTLEMLELGYDPLTHQYQVPVQLLAMNGLLLVDDLGRQAVSHEALLNRWIVPMEERRDFLTLKTGERFELPFELSLVFATNLPPAKLGDEAFLRRIGHKIKFSPVDPQTYERIWRDACTSRDVEFSSPVLRHLMESLYPNSGVNILPCHPRDLLENMVDEAIYRGLKKPFSFEIDQLERAWSSYIVQEAELSRDETTH